MYTKWTKHLEGEDKVDFVNSIYSAKTVLERLQFLLKEEGDALDRSEIDIKTFDQPNWQFRQAYKNGYRAALGVLNKLIDLDQQKKD